jgi:hypothetical protein
VDDIVRSMEITDLTPAEEQVREAFLRGASVDLREMPGDEAADGHAWGPGRTVRAEVLRALLLGDHPRDGRTPGLWLEGAHIAGRLHLAYGAVEYPVHLGVCHFDESPSFYGAQLRQLELNGSYLPSLNAATVRIDGVLRMTACRVPGKVALGGARIAGALFLDHAELGTATGDPDPGQQEEAVLQLNHAVLGTDLWGTGLITHGQVRLLGAQVAGTVNLDDARLHHPGRTVLEAENLTVGADVRGMRLYAEGRVNLRGARIPGQLNLAYATLANPGSMALRASTAVIGELWLRDATPIRGSVNLRRAQIDFLHAAPGVWPGAVRLDGLTYTTLAPHEPAERRLPLLARDEGGYVPYAYEQLSAAYRRMGDDHAARTVQLTRQRRHRTTLPWYGRLWGLAQDVTVGYGFRPVRAAVWLFSLLLAGSVAYTLHHPHPLKAGEAPAFSPVFYTLDLLLPVIDFGQESAYTSEGWFQGLSYLLIITGWTLATTIATGVTRAVSRQ